MAAVGLGKCKCVKTESACKFPDGASPSCCRTPKPAWKTWTSSSKRNQRTWLPWSCCRRCRGSDDDGKEHTGKRRQRIPLKTADTTQRPAFVPVERTWARPETQLRFVRTERLLFTGFQSLSIYGYSKELKWREAFTVTIRISPARGAAAQHQTSKSTSLLLIFPINVSMKCQKKRKKCELFPIANISTKTHRRKRIENLKNRLIELEFHSQM